MSFESLKDRAFFRRSDFAEGFRERMTETERWRLLADRFDMFLSGRDLPARSNSIPRIIHQIWLGRSLPAEYSDWVQSWTRLNPGWDWRLWDDHSIRKLGLQNEMAFRKSRTPGARSDIARYELLYRFGGIYADTDFECLQPFEKVAGRCTFFAGTVFSDAPQLNNALIGSTAGHPLMKVMMDGLSQPVRAKGAMEVLAQSGPYYLTESFFASQGNLEESDVVFPSTYFYPLPNFVDRRGLTSQSIRTYLRDWSVAVHYWEGSWMRPSPARVFLSRVKKRLVAARKLLG